MEELVYLNGGLLPFREAKISVLDYGFLYGYGLFETMRAYNGVVFRLNDHLNRLAASAGILKIPVDIPELRKAVIKSIVANNLTEARIRLAVSIGVGSLVYDPKDSSQPTVLVVAKAYSPYNPEIYSQGFNIMVSSYRRNSQSPLAKLKTANYLESLLSRQMAKSEGADDAILLNEKNLLAETSIGNIFLVHKNILKTPGLENGILPGITRSVVLELASRLGIQVDEVDIQQEELVVADEVFLTNSIVEIMPVTKINGNPVNFGKKGLITHKLMNAYKDLVYKETHYKNH